MHDAVGIRDVVIRQGSLLWDPYLTYTGPASRASTGAAAPTQHHKKHRPIWAVTGLVHRSHRFKAQSLGFHPASNVGREMGNAILESRVPFAKPQAHHAHMYRARLAC